MQSKTKNRHDGRFILMCVCITLLCATLISGHWASGVFARYSSDGTATDKAYVASFKVEALGEESRYLQLSLGGTARYAITVENQSEVTVDYSVVLAFDIEITDWLEITIDGNGPTRSDGRQLEWDNVGTLNVGDSEVLTLVITTSAAMPEQLAGADSDSYEDGFGFQPFVIFEQKN